MIGQTISHYRIDAKLGEGGMGVVYLAEDLDLMVLRALKFLPQHAARSDQDRARLEREARAAASLEHPNICPVHEIGYAEGQPFIVMSYLEGRTLSARLAAEGQLPVSDALDIAVQVAGALSKAHAAGVVHRDIKPANVMLTSEAASASQVGGVRAVVMDFGLAQAADFTRVTKTGMALGTPAYMSPEQTRSRPVDARTDVWALGMMLYEMLAGRSPFAGENLAAVVHAIQSKEPAPLAEVRSDTPPDLKKVIDRALAKDPVHRYQTAEEMLADLQAVRDEQELDQKTAWYDRQRRLKQRRRWILSLGMVAVVVAVVLLWWSRHQDARRIDALAVLPFANLAGDAEQDYFADGMTDALITELQQLASDQVRVIGRTSVMSFKHTRKTLPEIARELNVDVIVEASVIRSGGVVKVAAKLIRALPEEQQLWADTYERNLQDILTLHADVAREVAAQVQLVLLPEEKTQLSVARPVDPAAYDAYLKGRHLLLNIEMRGVRSHDPRALVDFQLIETYLLKSIGIDSTFAPSWAGLAEYHIQREHNRIGVEAVPQAHAAAARALELDDTLGEAHTAMAHILWEHQYKPGDADLALHRALELNPNNPWAHLIKAYLFGTLGRYEEGAKAMLRALELDPLSRFINLAAWQPLAYAGWYEMAIDHIEKTRETYPDYPGRYELVYVYDLAGKSEEGLTRLRADDPGDLSPYDHLLVLKLLVKSGRLDEARSLLAEHRARAVEDSLFLTLSDSYARLGDLEEAGRWLAEYENRARPGFSNLYLAQVAGMIGRVDLAFHILEKAYEERNWALTRLAQFTENHPEWQPVASDPRYHDLVRRMGLRD